jgi:glutamate-ammonia-ligase adenylyltransferase
MPRLIAKCAASENATRTLTRTISIVEAIARRSAYLSLLSENPPALGQLTRLCAASPWISGQIARQPILLDELLDPRTLYTPPHPQELDALLDSRLRELDDKDLELRMDVLRQFKHAQVLRVAAADIAGSLPVSEVSNHLSAIAEAVLKAALDMAWSYLVERHGKPSCLEHGRRRPAGFAIVAYGKLGGLELGYGSDLDLVFLHDSRGDQQLTDGKKPIDNNVFFSRLAQRVIHFLSTVTAAGLTYEIDTRLRPSGASGLLVSNLDSYAAYQEKEAWTWEHQALVRARPVAGDAPTRTGFTAVRRKVLAQPRQPAKLRLQIADMRDRMRRELCAQESGIFDLKQGRGGITDIEFMVQYAVLRWAAECPELIDVTDNLRLLETLARVRLLSADDCATLRNAYFAYRADTHRLALQELPTLVSDTEHRAHRKGVIGLWQRMIEAR